MNEDQFDQGVLRSGESIQVELEKTRFDFCKNVDLHCLSPKTDLEAVVVIALEHGFRGIAVPMSSIETLSKLLKKNEDCHVVPIAVIDYPYGNMSTDIRAYSIMSAKEKGAGEVEVVAPYYMIESYDGENDKVFRDVYNDAQTLVATSKKANISLKYVMDQNSNKISDSVRTKMARIVSTSKIETVSTSLGFFDDSVDHSDIVIKMRTIKSKADCNIKVYIKSGNVDDLAAYVKAGADIVGLDWDKAANSVHLYEQMIHKKS